MFTSNTCSGVNTLLEHLWPNLSWRTNGLGSNLVLSSVLPQLVLEGARRVGGEATSSFGARTGLRVQCSTHFTHSSRYKDTWWSRRQHTRQAQRELTRHRPCRSPNYVLHCHRAYQWVSRPCNQQHVLWGGSSSQRYIIYPTPGGYGQGLEKRTVSEKIQN